MLGSGIRRALLRCFSWAQLFALPRAISHQAPLSVGFSRQEKWNGFLCPPPADLPDPGIKPTSHVSCVGRPVPYHKRHLRSTLISDLYRLKLQKIRQLRAIQMPYRSSVTTNWVCAFSESAKSASVLPTSSI